MRAAKSKQYKLQCESSQQKVNSILFLPSPPATTIRPRRKAAAKSALFVFIATVSSDFNQAPTEEEVAAIVSRCVSLCVCKLTS